MTEAPTKEMAVGRKTIVFGIDAYFMRSTRSATSNPTATATAGTITNHSTVRTMVCCVYGSVNAKT